MALFSLVFGTSWERRCSLHRQGASFTLSFDELKLEEYKVRGCNILRFKYVNN
jgi:hypothetical protein